jgi:hypothetical protein
MNVKKIKVANTADNELLCQMCFDSWEKGVAYDDKYIIVGVGYNKLLGSCLHQTYWMQKLVRGKE